MTPSSSRGSPPGHHYPAPLPALRRKDALIKGYFTALPAEVKLSLWSLAAGSAVTAVNRLKERLAFFYQTRAHSFIRSSKYKLLVGYKRVQESWDVRSLKSWEVDLYGCCGFLGPWRVEDRTGCILREAKVGLAVPLMLVQTPEWDVPLWFVW